MPSTTPKLALLVPDGAYEAVLPALLDPKRAKSLRWSPVPVVPIRDALHDSSPESVDLLRVYQGECAHAMVFKDLEGSGWEDRGAGALEDSIESELHASGWAAGRVRAIVVEPELEAWLRFGSTHMKQLVADRASRQQQFSEQLFKEAVERVVSLNDGWLQPGKPRRPKESFEGMLECFGVQRSNALYGRLAAQESLRGCAVPSFVRFVDTLRSWFPEASGSTSMARIESI
jgi:hypothetical protein